MLLPLLLALSTLSSSCPSESEWLDDTSVRLGDRARADHIRRAFKTCRALGATREACAVLKIIAYRESSGDGCAVHVRGNGGSEYGLGLHGLSWELHWPKWFRPMDQDVTTDAFRIPEISTVITLRLLRRAVHRYNARTWVEIHAVFAGRIKHNRAAPTDRDRINFCNRLAPKGIECNADASAQLGTKLGDGPHKGQQAFVAKLMP